MAPGAPNALGGPVSRGEEVEVGGVSGVDTGTPTSLPFSVMLFFLHAFGLPLAGKEGARIVRCYQMPCQAGLCAYAYR